RPADAASLAGGASFLQAGGTVLQLEALLLGSEEYFQKRGGGTVNGFLTAVYQDLFQQPPDDAGGRYWQQRLAGGEWGSAVALALASSPAARQQEVDRFYRGLVRRPAEPAGASYWMNVLLQGAPDAALVTALVISQEYSARLP